jgi:hypothetical protein
VTGLLTSEDGSRYCPMRGHAERDCPGYPTPEHMALSTAGIGWSSVPGPSNAELRDEMRADIELTLDETHGRGWDE